MLKSIPYIKTIKCRAIGVIPNEHEKWEEGKYPMFFEVDDTSYEMLIVLLNYKTIINLNKHHHWAVYLTHHGYHYVMECESWDEVKSHIIHLHILTGSDYMSKDNDVFHEMVNNIPSTMRLRISDKLDLEGNSICQAPKLLYKCECYKELRVGIKEVYDTFD